MITDWISRLARVLFPSSCAVCESSLADGEDTICTHCRWDMPLTDYWSQRENYLTELLAGRMPFENASALMYFGHESDYRLMIHRMKYTSRRDIAFALGQIYGRYLKESPYYADVTHLVPVPLHWTKRIKRGFNQSEELCRGMAVSMGVATNKKSLKRVRRTAAQARKTRADRWRNVEDAFGVRRPGMLHESHVLLVDDVITTGSTIEACGQAIVQSVENVRISIAALSVVKRTLPVRSVKTIDSSDTDLD